jgi:hypothetical protein
LQVDFPARRRPTTKLCPCWRAIFFFFFFFSSSPQECTSFNLYSVENLTRAEDGLEHVVDADEMVWRWAKPASPYRKSGWWYSTVDEAVTDGVWNAGRGFLLLIEKVGTWTKKAMFEGGRKPIMILSNETLERNGF